MYFVYRIYIINSNERLKHQISLMSWIRPSTHMSDGRQPASSCCMHRMLTCTCIVPPLACSAKAFGVKKFHQFFYGRKFTIYSDHKPLMYLFGEHRAISATASAWVQRWAVTLNGYQYSIVHWPGAQQGNADSFSRLTITYHAQGSATTSSHSPAHGMTVSSLVPAAHVRSWTDRDPTLAKVREIVQQGWPDKKRWQADESILPEERQLDCGVWMYTVGCSSGSTTTAQMRSMKVTQGWTGWRVLPEVKCGGHV